MGKALGFIEVSGTSAAIDALDIMCKTADVSLVTWERKLGGRLVTLIITGEVSAVKQSIDTACANCIKPPVAKAVIANPHEETLKIIGISQARLTAKSTAEDVKDDKNSAPDMSASVMVDSKSSKGEAKPTNKKKSESVKTIPVVENSEQIEPAASITKIRQVRRKS